MLMLEIFDLDMQSAHRSEKSLSFAWLIRLYHCPIDVNFSADTRLLCDSPHLWTCLVWVPKLEQRTAQFA